MTNIIIQKSDYSNIRSALVELHKRIFKLASDDDLKTTARHLGLLHKKTLDFKNECEVDILWDYLIYSYRPRGFNMAEKYLRINRNRLDDLSLALLGRMSEACYSVLWAKEVVRKGELMVCDLFQKTSFTILDKGLSESLKPGHAFSGNILKFDDFIMQTGASLPVDRDLFRDNEILQVVEKFARDPSTDSFVLHQADCAKLARATISAAIRLGYTDNVKYQ